MDPIFTPTAFAALMAGWIAAVLARNTLLYLRSPSSAQLKRAWRERMKRLRR